MMLVISPVMSLVFAVTVPLSIVVTRKMTKKTRPLFRKRSAKIGN
jgi:ATP-binding cassette subfamily B protein